MLARRSCDGPWARGAGRSASGAASSSTRGLNGGARRGGPSCRRACGRAISVRATSVGASDASSDCGDEPSSSSSSSSSVSSSSRPRARLKIFSVNDVYELENLGRLSVFIRRHTDNLREPFICTLNGDFLSPSLLSSYDLGAAAVSVMNAVPVTHACLGNHEFDHSTMILGQRLSELDAVVLNSNIVSTDEHHGLDEHGERVGAFVDALPKTQIVDAGGLRVGLLGVCTTSTPLSSAVKPRGVVFQDVVPIVRDIVRDFDSKSPEEGVDLTIALTHQTLCEDEALAREVPELGLILGGHEHHPFHGAIEGTDVLCFKAGMDSENVVELTLEIFDDDVDDGNDSAVDFEIAADSSTKTRRGAASLARAMRVGAPSVGGSDDDDESSFASSSNRGGGLKTVAAVKSPSSSSSTAFIEDVVNMQVVSGASARGHGWDVQPGPSSTMRALRGRVHVTATLHSLYGYERCPEIDRNIWERSEVLRDLHEYVLPLHEHAERLDLLPLSSLDVRQQQTTLGTLFATILRDECAVDLCLYNSGGVRGNKTYEAPLTYGDFVAEVPFENNICTLEMTGADIYRALSYSEEQKTETCSWGGYLLWDIDVDVRATPGAVAAGDLEVTIRGEPLDPERVYRVVTWAGLLDGADGIPAFEEVGVRLAESLGVEAGSMSSATFSADGVPFKILIMRHLCRWRWRQLNEMISFEDMDANADGSVEVEDIRIALETFTASESSRQEAESMVRLFDVDGDGKISKHEWLALLDS